MKLPLILFAVAFGACAPKSESLQKSTLKTEFSLSKILDEVSGIAMAKDGKSIVAIADQGNANSIFKVDFTGKIIGESVIEEAENNDWEDITADSEGFCYIGDFGNNENDRKDLTILKVNPQNANAQVLQKTTFYYPEQTAFPPKKAHMLYDCEAFVILGDSFILFTKNRSKNFDGRFLVYRVPNKAGHYDAQLVGDLKISDKFDEAAITSAALNPAKDKLILLSHSNIHILEGFSADNFYNVKIHTVALNHNSQKESIVFRNPETLWIADEAGKKTPAMVYSFVLKN